MEKLQQRRTKVANWYLDMSLASIGAAIASITTQPLSTYIMPCGGTVWLQKRDWQIAGSGINERRVSLGVRRLRTCLHVERVPLPTLTTVCIPEGRWWAIARKLLTEYNIEIGVVWANLPVKSGALD